MRIGIDAYPLNKNKTAGLGVYVLNLIEHLDSLDKNNEYFLYTGKNFALPFQNRRWHIRAANRWNLFSPLHIWWLMFGAKKMLCRDKIDVFIATTNFLPLSLPRDTKKILIIHDLVLFVCPQTLGKIQYLIHKLIFEKSVRLADEIVAVSSSTKSDIEKYFPEIASKKIHLVYSGGPRKLFQPYNKEAAKEHLYERLNLSGKYILTVSSMEWRKNLIALLQAFSLCKNKYQMTHKLICVIGEKRAQIKKIYKMHKRLGLGEAVVFLNRVDMQDLLYLYNGADIFVFPSLYEGFGFPPLEAMACGIPVVASEIPVFKEVLNGAALMANPKSPEDIAEKIYRLVSGTEQRDKFISNGFEQVKVYAWESTARKILEICERVNMQQKG
jgi:glycosyltransferase involved in cell wall biosynthesis